jgi:hypothetical protein
MMYLKKRAKHIKIFAVFIAAVIVVLLSIVLWPKSFAYSDCGQCEMLGSEANIERLKSLEVSSFGMKITAVVNTTCYQRVTAKQEFSDGRIILKVEPAGEPISNHCLCDRELTFNLPNYAGAKTVELYYENRLVDKRSIVNNTLSDGLEFCESDATYRPFCYYRAAFMKEDFSFCEKTAEPKRCKEELEEFLTLKCVAHDGQYCKGFFAEKE